MPRSTKPGRGKTARAEARRRRKETTHVSRIPKRRLPNLPRTAFLETERERKKALLQLRAATIQSPPHSPAQPVYLPGVDPEARNNHITPTKRAHYVQSGGIACPFCGNHDIVPDGPIEVAIPFTIEILCMGCGSTWQEEYQLTNVHNTGTIKPYRIPMTAINTEINIPVYP